MEEGILKELTRECRLEKGKANFIKLLIKICLDNKIVDIKKEIKDFLR